MRLEISRVPARNLGALSEMAVELFVSASNRISAAALFLACITIRAPDYADVHSAIARNFHGPERA